MSWVLVEGLWCCGSRLLLGCWQPRLHEAVSEVDLIEVDLGQGGCAGDHLEGHEEEGVPEDGQGVALPDSHIVRHPLGEELIAVVKMKTHPNQDWYQGEDLR